MLSLSNKIKESGVLSNVSKDHPEPIVKYFLDELLTSLIVTSDKKRDMEMYFYDPLASREDIVKITDNRDIQHD